MKRNWNQKELDEHFSLLPNENHLVLSKKTSANRIGFAILLKYFQQEAQFPNQNGIQERHLIVNRSLEKVADKSFYINSFQSYR